MSVTKPQAQAVTAEIMQAVEAILAKHGLDKPSGVRSTYGDQYKLTITTSSVELNDDGINTASAEAIAYERYAFSYGLHDGLLGTKFMVRGEEWTFLGIATKRSKYPIMARNAAGKTMLHTIDVCPKINVAGGKSASAARMPTLTEVPFPGGEGK